MEPCPSHACTVVSGTPLMSRSQAAVCRRSWRVRPRPGRAAAEACRRPCSDRGRGRGPRDGGRGEACAGKRAAADLRVTELRQEAEQARREQNRLAERHLRESVALRRQVLGSATPSTVSARAGGWRARAEQARHALAQIEALPVAEAAQLVGELAARAEAERQAAERAQAAREARAAQLGRSRPSSAHGRTGLGRGAARAGRAVERSGRGGVGARLGAEPVAETQQWSRRLGTFGGGSGRMGTEGKRRSWCSRATCYRSARCGSARSPPRPTSRARTSACATPPPTTPHGAPCSCPPGTPRRRAGGSASSRPSMTTLPPSDAAG